MHLVLNDVPALTVVVDSPAEGSHCVKRRDSGRWNLIRMITFLLDSPESPINILLSCTLIAIDAFHTHSTRILLVTASKTAKSLPWWVSHAFSSGPVTYHQHHTYASPGRRHRTVNRLHSAPVYVEGVLGCEVAEE